MRKRIFDIIQIGSKSDLPSRLFDYFIVAAITLNILSLFLETFSELEFIFPVLRAVEIATLVFFCIEYILRIWTADYLYPQKSRAKAIVRFIFSFDGIVDLLTIIPMFFLSGFIALRILRVVRIFHLFRINNTQYDSFHIITTVLMKKKNQIISSVFIIMILMLASSLGMYSAEHEAQPEVFENAFSGIWWSVSTVLTVGYGDIYPITVVGRIMAIVISFLGVGAVAIPTGIISAGFVEQYQLNEHSGQKPDIAEIGEVLADGNHGFIGKSISELKRDYRISVYMVLRGELTLVATDNLVIERDDVLIVQSDKIVKKQQTDKMK